MKRFVEARGSMLALKKECLEHLPSCAKSCAKKSEFCSSLLHCMAFNVLRAASHVCTAQDPGKNLGAKEALKKGTSIIIVIIMKMKAHILRVSTPLRSQKCMITIGNTTHAGG